MFYSRLLFSLVGIILCASIPHAATTPSAQSIAQQESAAIIIIHAGTLIAVPGERPLRMQSIVVRGRRIEAIHAGFMTLPGATVVDLSKATVLPGLIDSHVHLGSAFKKKDRGWGSSLRKEAESVLTALENAAVTVKAGFTTVRDVGGDPRVIFAVRDAIGTGRFPGPRILAAGHMISVTAGHADDAPPSRLKSARGLLSGICDGPFECRTAVRAQVGAGADLIKISATGGGGDENGTADAEPEMANDEMTAIVETAHALGRKVAVHAHGTAGINSALRAGADSIEHGGFLNAESIRLLKVRHAFVVPTMSVLSGIEAEIPGADPRVQPLMRSFLDRMPDNIGTAYRAGVTIAFGTDAGITEHGKNAQEFLWYRKISMSATDAVRTATLNAAALLGVSADLGSIVVGKYADIIATNGDPLTDIAELQKVAFVMKDGVVVRPYQGNVPAEPSAECAP